MVVGLLILVVVVGGLKCLRRDGRRGTRVPDFFYEDSGFLEEDPAPFVPMSQVDMNFDAKPLLNALRFVVLEARKRALAGHNDELVNAGRVAQAALVWWKYDRAQEFEKAATWLARIPRVK